MGVKVAKPDTYDGAKGRGLDTWLFQIREHLNLTVIPKWGHILYAASLLCGNTALWWREMCKANRCPATWEDFCHVLREQFRLKITVFEGETSWQEFGNMEKNPWLTSCFDFAPRV